MPLGREIGLDRSNIVLDGDPVPPPPKGAEPPISGQCLLWANGWVDQDATWYRGRHRPRRLCVRCGPRCPQKGGRASHFLSYVYCGRTARCIKMPLARAIGLGSGDIIFDGDRAPPPKKRGTAPNFQPTCIVAKRLDGATWFGGRPRPRRRCVG